VNEERVLGEDVAYEEAVVVDADAVVDPRTVVVEALHALVAHTAMSATDCTQDLTFRAQLSRVELFHQPQEVNTLSYESRVTHCRHYQEYERECK
jgi:hypothetical protein